MAGLPFVGGRRAGDAGDAAGGWRLHPGASGPRARDACPRGPR